MPEEFLHYIWLYQLFDHSDLRTEEGEVIQIVSPGIHNQDSGPDFSHARIIIDGNIWVGNIEIHGKTSDWISHQHQHDPAYSNVILHVVYIDNSPTNNDHLDSIPVLQLNGRMDMNRYLDWKKLRGSRKWIPCEPFLKDVEPIVISQMIQSAAIGRLERKVEGVLLLNERVNGHWEFTMMKSIIISMGTKVNKEAFSVLASIIPFQLIKKFESSPHKMEAMIFGISGLLESKHVDAYSKKLYVTYQFLKRKHNLIELKRSIWKFMRMRPLNFPSIRLAQLVAVLLNWTKITNCVFYNRNFKDLEGYFRTETNEYWNTHYRFTISSKISSKKMGASMYNKILINALLPFLYSYGLKHDDRSYCQMTLDLLESLIAEKNAIIRQWSKRGVEAKNALESQGLIEIKNNYCSAKKCLTCKIGICILN